MNEDRPRDLKYPRTFHLPTSPGLQSDDRRLSDLTPFLGRRVIVTEKIDGECTTMTPEKTYPRSPDARYHPSRDWMRAFHARRAADIPAGWRISGEYAYARHSIAYTRALGNALDSYFLGFGAWDQNNVLLPWDDSLEMLELLDVRHAPVLYDGPFDDRILARLASSIDIERQEGFVMRIADAIPYPPVVAEQGRFFPSIAKWVRKDHVQTDDHWLLGPIVPNELREGVTAIP
jgi:hypothetical protein